MPKTEKTCTKCRKTKNINEFSINRMISDNRDIYCRECKKYLNSKRNLEKYKKQNKKRYNKNKKKILKQKKIEYWENPQKMRDKTNNNDKKRLLEWRSFLPENPKCSICEKQLFYNAKDTTKAVVFDHRHGGKEPIKRRPGLWLRSNKRTKIKEEMWTESDFGVLCRKCNAFLPTNIKKRKKMIINLTKYNKLTELKREA